MQAHASFLPEIAEIFLHTSTSLAPSHLPLAHTPSKRSTGLGLALQRSERATFKAHTSYLT